jgi:hypothetical protein
MARKRPDGRLVDEVPVLHGRLESARVRKTAGGETRICQLPQ